MSKISLEIGLVDKITKHQELSTMEARKTIEKIVSHYGIIYSLDEGQKSSKNKSGSILNENILKLEFPDITKEIALEVIESIKTTLNIEGIWLHEIISENTKVV